jgi:pyrroline-5-carboxylate reductase
MKIGFIGAGKMAEAIMAALVKSKTAAPNEVLACDINAERRETIRRRLGVGVYSKADAVVGAAEVVVLAVKPQDLQAALEPLAPHFTSKHLVLSIAAGKTLAFLEGLLPAARVIRVMPNLPSVVGEGMSVFCSGAQATSRDRARARTLLASFGKVLELPESALDAVTALSGSGPAFFAYVLEAMIAGAVGLGLDRTDARLLAEQTMLGTSRYLVEIGDEPQAFIAAVASPKGTTAAGLEVLEASDLRAVLARTLGAAAHRSHELSAG